MFHFSRSAADPRGASPAEVFSAAVPDPPVGAAPGPPPAGAPGGAKRSAFAGFDSVPAFATSSVSVAVSSVGARHWLSLQGWYEITAVSVRGPGAAFASAVPDTRNTARPS